MDVSSDLFLNLRKKVYDHLLGPRLYDSFSLDQFRKCFPRTHRDKSDVVLLHEMFVVHRQQVRARVDNLIKRRFAQLERAARAVDVVDVEGLALPDALAFLSDRQAALQDEMRELEREVAAARNKIARCESALSGMGLGAGADAAAVNVPHLDELLALLTPPEASASPAPPSSAS
ncbi:uncharacterized protein AMSG_05798 [Thecamonas trahens ATCC 50062]|uniref:Uncharacterized protein n=1 Tax=Thecamonas trahens ATCC 50062 TaxID=461836 RepID=A0A0L0DCH4_THETB|nr:hypothetical protein AMSG_05798 [Thecamonas trahens ATCC 50062]KNC50037.1 hypothetical protein AMSG_05798 [Thecamonas trahens ATCC 50062]|eukprot:XP_013757203.1 hypothetical protein AMSG_05798 [Thecamonas trahens ATCC 50062]